MPLSLDTTEPRPGVPWYIHPAEDPLAWQRLAAGDYGFAFAVINVSSGPGAIPDDDYYGPALADGLGTPAVGYVTVDYGHRPFEQVLRDAQHWQKWYSVHSVMLDCVPTSARSGDWSLDWIERLRDAGVETVIANPGAVPDPHLVMAADVTCVAEDDWNAYTTLELPGWLRAMPAERQWHLVHGVPLERLSEVPTLAAARGANFSWSTDHVMPNPWERLPAPYLG